MGRFLLILIASASILGVIFTTNTGSLKVDTAQRKAQSEAGVLARTAARSGFEVIEAQLKDDISLRPNAIGIALDAAGVYGSYDVITDTLGGGVNLRVIGRFGEAAHRIEANLIPSLDFPAAIVLNTEEIDAKFSGQQFLVSGMNALPPSASGGSPMSLARPAILAPTPEIEFVLRDEIKANQLDRFLGSTDIEMNTAPLWVHELVGEAKAATGATVYEKFEQEDGTLGSPSAPAFIVAEEAKLEGNFVGYGVLYVTKKVEMKDNARWEGLVLMETEAGEKCELKMEANTSIWGGVMIYGSEKFEEQDNNPGLPGGHFDLDFFWDDGGEMTREYHQHEYDDKHDVSYLDFFTSIDLADSFADFIHDYGTALIRVESFNDFNGTGTYSIATHSQSWSGDAQDGFSFLARPMDFTDFHLDLDCLKELRGSSPGRVKGDDVDRDRSYSIRFYEGATLVYEVSFYEHAKSLRDGTPGACAGIDGSAGATSAGDVYGKAKVEMKDDAQIHLSVEALARLAPLLPTIGETFGVETQLVISAPMDN